MTNLPLISYQPRCPRSAAKVLRELRELAPALLLLDLPADAAPLLGWVGHPGLVPPVAISLRTAPKGRVRGPVAQQTLTVPLAAWSPQWQALRFAQERGIQVQLVGLPAGAPERSLNLEAAYVHNSMASVREAAAVLCREELADFIYKGSDVCGGPAQVTARPTEAAWLPWADALEPDSAWQRHLWECRDLPVEEVGRRWLVRAARILRQSGEASAAEVVEAARLAETLAALRSHSAPDLEDLMEAATSVFCEGRQHLPEEVRSALVVGRERGTVPEGAPAPPLLTDFNKLRAKLRLREDPSRELDLDLRQEFDRERSEFLHRLTLLGLPWARSAQMPKVQRGSFRESWLLEWRPEFAQQLADHAAWGDTVLAAAEFALAERVKSVPGLAELAHLLECVLLAELPEGTRRVVSALRSAGALCGEVPVLIRALEPLVRILRYGSVRRRDHAQIAGAASGLATRICIGLPGACIPLGESGAREMSAALEQAHAAFTLWVEGPHLADWWASLRRVADLPAAHGLLAGRASRLLWDLGERGAEETSRRWVRELSSGSGPLWAVAWLEGFMGRSPEVLLGNRALRQLLQQVVRDMSAPVFAYALPLLRRLFSAYRPEELRQLGQLLSPSVSPATVEEAASTPRNPAFSASRLLPLSAQLLNA